MAKVDVGFCKPPKHTQFKKGVSGNPAGRPKGSLNMATVLRETLSQTIVVFENGQRKSITKMQAAVRRLVDESIAGDMSAFRVLSVLTQVLNDSPNGSSSELEASDQKVIANLMQQFTHAPRQ